MCSCGTLTFNFSNFHLRSSVEPVSSPRTAWVKWNSFTFYITLVFCSRHVIWNISQPIKYKDCFWRDYERELIRNWLHSLMTHIKSDLLWYVLITSQDINSPIAGRQGVQRSGLVRLNPFTSWKKYLPIQSDWGKSRNLDILNICSKILHKPNTMSIYLNTTDLTVAMVEYIHADVGNLLPIFHVCLLYETIQVYCFTVKMVMSQNLICIHVVLNS